MEHTPEPWKISTSADVWYDGPHHTQQTVDLSLALDRRIALCSMDEFPRVQNDANARRIVACVNACKGIPTEDLETMAGESIRLHSHKVQGFNPQQHMPMEGV